VVSDWRAKCLRHARGSAGPKHSTSFHKCEVIGYDAYPDSQGGAFVDYSIQRQSGFDKWHFTISLWSFQRQDLRNRLRQQQGCPHASYADRSPAPVFGHGLLTALMSTESICYHRAKYVFWCPFPICGQYYCKQNQPGCRYAGETIRICVGPGLLQRFPRTSFFVMRHPGSFQRQYRPGGLCLRCRG